jgi:DNA-binding NtrC family response regulator
VFLEADADPRLAHERFGPVCVLLDLHFLGEGVEAVQAAFSAVSPAPIVVAVTRQPSIDSAVRVLTAGASDYFVLPSDRERLAASIARIVREGSQPAGSPSPATASAEDRLVIDLPAGGLPYDEYEKQIIRHVLDRHRWNRSRAARELRISRPRLLRKIEKYGLRSR